MNKNEIIASIFKWLHLYTHKIEPNKMLADDLTQEIALILLDKDEELIKDLYIKCELIYYVIRIIHNQYYSKTSSFHNKYRKIKTLELNDLIYEEGKYDFN